MTSFGGLCCHILVLLCAVLDVASSASGKLSHNGQLTSASNDRWTAPHDGHFLARASSQHPHPPPIVALQASQKTHLKAGAARSKSTLGRRAKRSRLDRMIHAQDKLSRRQKESMKKLGICRGKKLRWWIKIKKKCTKAYGQDSKWDRSRLDGKCGDAWNSCNTGFYAVCCSQPLGPKNLKAYCEKQNLTAKEAIGDAVAATGDKACEVEGAIREVQGVVQGIK